VRSQTEAAGKPSATFETFARERSTAFQFPAGMSDPPYPLALAMFQEMNKKFPQAATHLLAMRRPRRLPERIVKRVLTGHVIVMAAVQEGNWSHLREAAAKDVLGLLKEAQNWPLTQLPLWLREWLQHDIDQRLQQAFLREGKKTKSALRKLQRFLAGRSDTTWLESKISMLAELTNEKNSAEMASALRAASRNKITSSDRASCQQPVNS
jgi:hypothetical protein